MFIKWMLKQTRKFNFCIYVRIYLYINIYLSLRRYRQQQHHRIININTGMHIDFIVRFVECFKLQNNKKEEKKKCERLAEH